MNHQNTRTPLSARIFPFLQWWPMVNRSTLRSDLIAGLSGAIIVLPQGVAFAMIAGLPPIYGLYSAMVISVVAALFGSSMHLVSGPSTAISLLVFATMSKVHEPGSTEYIQAVLAVTFLAGIFQLALGFARMGTLVNFVSQVVIVGFTAGAAVLIIIHQLKHFLGISLPSGQPLPETLVALAVRISETNLYALGVGALSFAVAILSKKYFPKLPNLLLALLAGTLAGAIFGGESVGLKLVGEVQSAIPKLSSPQLSWKVAGDLLDSAFAVAILGLIQSVAIARSLALKTDQQLDVNQEFVGQGLANLAGSFFSSYAGSGSFIRSGINLSAGAKTPLSSVFSALILFVILLFVARYIAFLPLAAMAGVIVLVGYNLVDFQVTITVAKASRRQMAVLLITLFATLFLQLEYAIYLGVFFSLIIYLQQASTPNVAVMAPDPAVANRRFKYLLRKQLPECPQVKLLRIDGSIFFGSVFHIATELRRLTEGENSEICHVLILAKGINFIDVAGCEWLMQEATHWRMKGGGLYITGLKLIAQDSLIRGGYKKKIGEEHFFDTKEMAIKDIFTRLNREICASCTNRIFLECQSLPCPANPTGSQKKSAAD